MFEFTSVWYMDLIRTLFKDVVKRMWKLSDSGKLQSPNWQWANQRVQHKMANPKKQSKSFMTVIRCVISLITLDNGPKLTIPPFFYDRIFHRKITQLLLFLSTPTLQDKLLSCIPPKTAQQTKIHKKENLSEICSAVLNLKVKFMVSN